MSTFGPHEYRDHRHQGAIPIEGSDELEGRLLPSYPELEQAEDFGPTPVLLVKHDGPVRTHELPTQLAVARTLGVLGPERILPRDPRRAKATLIASVQGLRLAKTQAELRAGGSGQVGVGSGSGSGAQFSTSGGGTGGFLLPVGLVLPVTSGDELYAASDDYGVGNNPCMVSLMIEQWTG